MEVKTTCRDHVTLKEIVEAGGSRGRRLVSCDLERRCDRDAGLDSGRTRGRDEAVEEAQRQ